MTTSPHVCCPNCVILSDDFNRTALGCNWEVRHGSWSINDYQLRESGNADALVIGQRESPGLSFYVVVQIPCVISGAVYRVVDVYSVRTDSEDDGRSDADV